MLVSSNYANVAARDQSGSSIICALQIGAESRQSVIISIMEAAKLVAGTNEIGRYHESGSSTIETTSWQSQFRY
jgi:hypothetical protein